MTIPDPKFKKGDKVHFTFYGSDCYPPVSYTFYGIIQFLNTYNHQINDHTYCVKITKGEWREVFENCYPEMPERYLRLRIKPFRKPVKKIIAVTKHEGYCGI